MQLNIIHCHVTLLLVLKVMLSWLQIIMDDLLLKSAFIKLFINIVMLRYHLKKKMHSENVLFLWSICVF